LRQSLGALGIEKIIKYLKSVLSERHFLNPKKVHFSLKQPSRQLIEQHFVGRCLCFVGHFG
jgi:hypothetical protein